MKSSLALALALFFFASSAQALLQTPPLRVLPYEQLELPPQLQKAQVKQFVQWAADGLYLEAFVELGSMSDFMHLHALFRPLTKDIEEPRGKLSSVGTDYDWAQVELTALLIHTQEYDHLRPDRKFLTPDGQELDRRLRNFILWTSGQEQIPGTLVRAHEYSIRNHPEPPHTVYASELDPELFGRGGPPWEYSFYFFRVHCAAIDSRGETEVRLSSLLEVNLHGERVCLNLVSFYCRNRPADKKRCGTEEPIASYYPY